MPNLNAYFTQYQLMFSSGNSSTNLLFPSRANAHTDVELWKWLRLAWRAFDRAQPEKTPFQLTANMVNITAILKIRVVVSEVNEDHIQIDYLSGSHPKITPKSVRHCHRYDEGKLYLYDERGDPATQLTIDSHLVEMGISLKVFAYQKDVVAAVRWKLEHVVRELTEPCDTTPSALLLDID